ncbi:hypothetical protein DL95DRAFT_414758 [Leptodontidium sp. 2 PMI_412]|nr:hypothetical protein DL95DRAFT_414758 [Leptodontidium sp. 2 PMI_412]
MDDVVEDPTRIIYRHLNFRARYYRNNFDAPKNHVECKQVSLRDCPPQVCHASTSVIMFKFSTDLQSLFNASPILSASNVTAQNLVVTEDQYCADLDLGVGESSPAISSRQRLVEVKVEGEDSLPVAPTIPRPEELLRKLPNWIFVKQMSLQMVVVHGSHGPSLACLDEYLRRWCRGEVNRVNRPPVVEIRLLESAFGLGLLQDTLTIETIRGREVTPMLVLVFVEGVLGYTPNPSGGSAESVWEFKRMK